jgi:hypothetical protein
MNMTPPPEIACALSPTEYVARIDEFRRLVTTAVRAVRREPTQLFLSLDPSPTTEQDVRDLLRREQECCPFFTFSIDSSPTTLVVEAGVSTGADECLDDLEQLATRALASRAQRA